MAAKPFNKLTPAEAERLALLAEECAECIQAIGKILRHGYESRHPDAPPRCTNRWDLTKEMGHVRAAMSMMIGAGDTTIGCDSVDMFASLKLRDVPEYLHHQRRRSTNDAGADPPT